MEKNNSYNRAIIIYISYIGGHWFGAWRSAESFWPWRWWWRWWWWCLWWRWLLWLIRGPRSDQPMQCNCISHSPPDKGLLLGPARPDLESQVSFTWLLVSAYVWLSILFGSPFTRENENLACTSVNNHPNRLIRLLVINDITRLFVYHFFH